MAFESPMIGAEIEGQKLCEKIAAKLCENVLNNKEPKFGGTNTCFRAKWKKKKKVNNNSNFSTAPFQGRKKQMPCKLTKIISRENGGSFTSLPVSPWLISLQY